jgi:signal peptidase
MRLDGLRPYNSFRVFKIVKNAMVWLMDKEIKQGLIVIIAVVAAMLIFIGGVTVASGINPPQTVVQSGSMQHSMHSQIGIIDTGDLIIIKNKDRVDIRTFVDGYKTGYETFGSYGNVIIYTRAGQDPVIHRAILWLEYNGDDTWSAPSLENYPQSMWKCTSGYDHERMYGVLTLKDMGCRYTDESINLDTLSHLAPHSGYLTMGDNNSGFDQPSHISGVHGLIPYDDIESVAWFEIPWVGAVRMLMDGKIADLNYWVPNTIPCLATAVLSILFLMVGISFFFDYRYYERTRKELSEKMNAPAPIFPVEKEDE